ncbi:acyl-CoA dehydrogenase family protein [Nonomuraea guangzhouensis]|uniref:Acyl-CoA dehydrogenase family protein n=1 Tax=Nonomuraea guangzhouensis TaxID=1291555 RepID=A0ABW4GA79_9ACTN|nr:acyl-CoA dehydrogenase family protein [Nonomuraea guangzhouensis]
MSEVADSEVADMVTAVVGDRADGWDRAGRLPGDVLRELGAKGVLCPQVPAEYGGLGLTSLCAGELTAYVGSLCGSLRSVMTAQGISAWTVQRFGSPAQQAAYLTRLAFGEVAGVAFSEPDAGSDLSAMVTRIRDDGDSVVVDGHKVWVTGAAYADLLVVFGRYGGGAAAVVVPTSATGVAVERVPDPLACRAAGHADVRLDSVRVPADCLLGGVGLVDSALTYGRLSVAWGCVGILRACLSATARHAKSRRQFGKRLADHQLVARQLAELFVAEQAATRVCEHASRCWDAGTPDLVTAALLAKHLCAGHAARGASSAVQVLGSAGVRDGGAVARAYRDAKAMEIIEGSNEICQLALAEHALGVWS